MIIFNFHDETKYEKIIFLSIFFLFLLLFGFQIVTKIHILTAAFLLGVIDNLILQGIVSEEKLDTFNLPVYHMSPQELEEVVERNGCFSIERMNSISFSSSSLPTLVSTNQKAQAISFHIRAVTEELIKAHFGEEILDQLFNSYSKKLEEEYYSMIESSVLNLCAVLKRKKTMN